MGDVAWWVRWWGSLKGGGNMELAQSLIISFLIKFRMRSKREREYGKRAYCFPQVEKEFWNAFFV